MESDLASLIARLETAKEGSRELDRSVWAWVAEHVWKWPEGQTGADADGKNNSVILIPTDLPKGFTYAPKGAVDRYYHVPSDPVTTDISAAVALARRLFPKCCISLNEWHNHADAGLSVNERELDLRTGEGEAPTTPVALCLAILRAKDAAHD